MFDLADPEARPDVADRSRDASAIVDGLPFFLCFKRQDRRTLRDADGSPQSRGRGVRHISASPNVSASEDARRMSERELRGGLFHDWLRSRAVAVIPGLAVGRDDHGRVAHRLRFARRRRGFLFHDSRLRPLLCARRQRRHACPMAGLGDTARLSHRHGEKRPSRLRGGEGCLSRISRSTRSTSFASFFLLGQAMAALPPLADDGGHLAVARLTCVYAVASP